MLISLADADVDVLQSEGQQFATQKRLRLMMVWYWDAALIAVTDKRNSNSLLNFFGKQRVVPIVKLTLNALRS